MRSLAGTGVEGFAAALDVAWTPVTFDSKAHPEFDFEMPTWMGEDRGREHGSVTGEVAADGTVSLLAPGVSELTGGLWRGTATWSITEPGGRTVSARAPRLTYDDERWHVGLALFRGDVPAGGVVASGEASLLRLVAVDPGDVPVDGGNVYAIVQSVRTERRLAESGGSLSYVYEDVVEPRWSKLVNLSSGAAELALPALEPGHYRLAIEFEEGGDLVGTTFWSAEDPWTFEPDGEERERVTVTTDAREVEPGETVTVTLDAPFDGTALVALEDDRVRWHRAVAVEERSATLEIDVPADVRGGLCVSVQLTRPIDPGAATWKPHRAYGFARVETRHPTARVETSIDAPARVRPGGLAQVTVGSDAGRGDTRPGRVHLWAVDEGIRLVGGHRVPDPVHHFFGPRRRGLATTDGWFDLVADLAVPESVTRIGGDAAGGVARHRAPDTTHRDMGVLWLESRELDADGGATFDVRVPDFTGQLTWMAVVVDGDRYGRADAATTLSGELPLAVSVPRFAAPGDQFSIPVRVDNKSEEAATFELTLQGEGLERLAGPLAPPSAVEAGSAAGEARAVAALEPALRPGDDRTSSALELAPGERTLVWFRVEAGEEVGGVATGQVTLTGAFAGGRPASETYSFELPIRTGRPLVTRVKDVRLDAGDVPSAINLGAALDMDRIEGGEVRVSPRPDIQWLPAGRYLTGYPHGCAEQTASRLRALAAMPELLGRGDDPGLARAEAADRIHFAFERLRAMRHGSGALTYWPGQRDPSHWASTYAAMAIHDARSFGFEVPDDLSAGLVRALKARLFRGVETRFERAALVHALALLGAPAQGHMARLEELVAELSSPARAELASALSVAGEHDRALAVLAGHTRATEAVGGPLGRLATSPRVAALGLRTLVRSGAAAVDVETAARELSALRQRDTGRFGNTIENADVLVALAEYADSVAPEGGADWAGTIGDQPVNAVDESRGLTLVPGQTSLGLDIDGSGPVFLSIHGRGRLDRAAPKLTTELDIDRRWVDAAGEWVDPSAVSVGDLFFVELRVRATARGRRFEDCVVIDPLPAGLEVENPRLAEAVGKALEGPVGESDGPASFEADRTEFLDDRVVVFGTVDSRPRVIRYPVRAIAAGSFEWAPATVEDMYSPQRSATSGSTRVLEVR